MLPLSVQPALGDLQAGLLSPSPFYLSSSTNSTPPDTAALLRPLTPRACLNPRGWYRCQCTHLAVAWKPMRCRHCEPCQAARRGKVIARAVNAMGQLDYLVFVTLTTVNRSPRLSWPEIMGAWSRVVAWIRRVYGPVEYMVVKEEGKGGMRHLHAVFANWVWVPVVALSAEWQRLTGAYRVWIDRVVGGAGVAGYLAKYLAKGDLPLRKLATYSQGFPKLPVVEYIEYARFSGPPEPRPWVWTFLDGSHVEWWGTVGQCACFGTVQRLE